MIKDEQSTRSTTAEATGTASLTLSAHAAGGARLERTGRMIGENAEHHELASAWAKLRDPLAMSTHPAAAELASLAPGLPIYSTSAQAYRGRSSAEPPTALSMGPPPDHLGPFNGRYCTGVRPVLYLSSTVKGVEQELSDSEGTPIYVQRFFLPVDELRIADLRPETGGGAVSQAEFVNDVFFFCEVAKEGDSPDTYATFKYSQLIARLIAEHFDGMVIPGVRAEAESRYWNIVIFRPESRWRDWLDPHWSPRAI